jgi:putative membrane protein
MSRMSTLAIAFVSLGFTAAALAGVSAGERKFVEDAAIGGRAQVELGKVATARGSNERVRQFGQRMINNHRTSNAELKRIANGKGIQVPASLDKKRQKDLDDLKKKDAKQFDREYVEMMVKDHRKDVAEFEKQARSGKDPDIKAFASKSLPAVKEDLAHALSTRAALAPGK